MKVRVLPVEEGLEPKFRIIAETVEDELFLKQLAGMYGDGTVSLENVVFNGDGVSSLVVVGDTFPFPGNFCERVQACMAGFTPEHPAIQPPATVLIQNTTYNLEGYSLNFKGNQLDENQLERDFDSNGNDWGGYSNSIGADNYFNSIRGFGNTLGDDNTLNTVVGANNTLADQANWNLLIGINHQIGINSAANGVLGSGNIVGANANANNLYGINNVVSDGVNLSAAWGEGHNITCNLSYMFGSWGVCPQGGISIGNGTDNLNRNNSHILRNNGSYRHDGAYANKPTRYTGGGNAVIPDNVSIYIYDPATVQAGATITLPANPLDGQTLYIFGGGTVTSGNVITSFTLDGNGRTVIGDGAAQLKVGKAIELHYVAANNIWYAISN
jgi:hypothetical protein